MKIRPLLLSAIVGSILTNACAAAPAPVVNNQGYPVAMEQSPNAQQTAASNKILYDLVNRIEQLQSEVRDLTGKIEEQSYQNAELKKRLTTMYSDFDERMQNLENKVSGGNQAAGSPAAENAGEADQAADLDNFQPAGEAQPGDENQAVNQLSAGEQGDAAANTQSEQAPAAIQQSVAPAPASESATAVSGDQEYKQAYDDLRNGRTAQSIEEFKAYLTRNPSGPLSGNAQYWLGEAYRVNQDFSSSRAAFNKVMESYPDSPKAPDALLKLGFVELDLNNKAKAGEYLNRVVSEYPNTNAARLAAKKLQSISASP